MWRATASREESPPGASPSFTSYCTDKATPAWSWASAQADAPTWPPAMVTRPW